MPARVLVVPAPSTRISRAKRGGNLAKGMWIATAALPAALDADLKAGNFAAAVAAPGREYRRGDIAFARGIALSNLGRARDARAAFEAALADPALADAATVELGFTDLTTPDGIAAVAARMQALAPKLAGVLAARASAPPRRRR